MVLRISPLALMLLPGCVEPPGIREFVERAPVAPAVPYLCSPGNVAEVAGLGYASAQAALDAATSGDEVILCVGTHAGGLVANGAIDLAVRGATGDPGDVIIDGGAATFGLRTVGSGGNLRVQGLSLSHTLSAAPGHDAALSLDYLQLLQIVDVRLTDNHGSLYSGVRGTVDAAVIERVEVGGNTGSAAIYLGLWEPIGSLLVSESVFHDNVATNPLVVEAAAPVLVRRSRFERNIGTGDGMDAAMMVLGPSSVTIEDSVVTDSYNPNGVAGVYIESPRVIVRRSLFSDNIGRWSGALSAVNGQLVQVSQSAFYRNETETRSNGTAISTTGTAQIDLRSVDFGAGLDSNYPTDINSCVTPDLVRRASVPAWRTYCR